MRKGDPQVDGSANPKDARTSTGRSTKRRKSCMESRQICQKLKKGRNVRGVLWAIDEVARTTS